MKNILLTVDDTKSSMKTINGLFEVLGTCLPERITLLYVEKIEGHSVMDELLLSESEVSTLKKSLQGTEYQDLLDKKARKVISHYTTVLNDKGVTAVTPLIKEGHPAEEILKAAKEEAVGMIVMGSRGRRLRSLFMGSVSREVSNKADIPVLLVK